MKWRSFLLSRTLLFVFLLIAFTNAHSTIVSGAPSFNDGIRATTSDRQMAREVHQALRELRNNRTNTATLQRLVTSSRTSIPFGELNSLFSLLHKISTIRSSPPAFYEACNYDAISNQSIGMSPLEERILGDIQSHCRHLFLSLIRGGSLQANLDERALNFMRASLTHYLSGEHGSLFESVLPRLMSVSTQRAQLNKLIEDIYIENNLTPSQAVLKELHPTTHFTQYVQSKEALDTQAHRYFRQQASSIISTARGQIDGDNFKGVDTHLSHFIAFYQQNSDFIGQQYAWANLNGLGRRLLYKKQFDLAKQAFTYGLIISNDSQIDESRFNVLWVDILRQDMRSAFQSIQQYSLLSNTDEHGSKLKFWMARVLDQVGQRTTASHLLEDIAKNDPMSFYAILSLRELSSRRKLSPLSHTTILAQRTPSSESAQQSSPLQLQDSFRRSLARLNLWLELDLDQYSFLEINYLYSAYDRDGIEGKKVSRAEFLEQLNWQLATFFNSRDKYLHTFRVLNSSIQNQTIPVTFGVLEQLFPTKYKQDIARIDPSVDPFVILALIRQESAFNPTARSSAGARGLMQIMPATGRSLQRNLTVAQLFNTDTNLRLGIRYFKRLANTYDGNLVYALAAYNAGQGNLRSWQRDIFVFGDDPLIQIEMIPFKETRKYVKLIYRNIYFYNLLNDKSLLDAPFESTLNLSFYSQTEPKS
jgi:soluble lytic murein transglycosylase